MFTSSRISGLVLRIGLAAVFLWLGVDKFVHPIYWVSAWIPPWASAFLDKVKESDVQFIYAWGLFEVVIALSLLINFFSKFFSFLAVVFLAVIVATSGLNEVTARDFGLMGGLLALIFWPERRGRL